MGVLMRDGGAGNKSGRRGYLAVARTGVPPLCHSSPESDRRAAWQQADV